MAKAQVIDEDLYTEGLETIIRRDFFPQSAKIRATLAMHEAVEAGDPVRIQAAKCQLAQCESSIVGNEDVSLDTANMSLDDFTRKFVSEDDASFKQLFEKEKETKRKKNAWMFDEHEATKTRLLKLGGPTALKQYEKEEQDKKAAIEERRLLMLPPPPRKPEGESASETGNRSKPTEINHSGTSLSSNAVGALATPGSISKFAKKEFEESQFEMMTGDLALLAQKKLMQQEQAYNLDDFNATPRSQVPQSPQVNGYKFLSTPQHEPGVDDGASPFITWGSISTPHVLATDTAESYTKGPQFGIAPKSKREETAHELADTASRRMRSEKRSLMSKTVAGIRRGTTATPARYSTLRTPSSFSATPKSSAATPRGDLTPAAQKLALQLGRVRSDIFNQTPKRRKLGSATPALSTPARTPIATPTRSLQGTPKLSQHHTTSTSSSHRHTKPKSSITDDLLNI
eukprot:TRINITY_DN103798_c0_g1_i1.p1 TRINITY_DN103798_c0_g1~~TRINITY_DN103798_c0_g1_i1.p1  ORF type:complete len:473 (-),score=57.88 TRINITY_DN103798_c0_g1_i1:118-1491(-)